MARKVTGSGVTVVMPLKLQVYDGEKRNFHASKAGIILAVSVHVCL